MPTVLLIGARGFLGSKVLKAVLDKNKYDVKVLIRSGSDTTKMEDLGVSAVVNGDMMDKESLIKAMEGIDIVINTANGYGQGHPEIDVEGAQYVADAAKECGVKRLIYCSVLTADKASNVEHFHNKYLVEEYMKRLDVPFVALRPGGFLDQATDFLGDGIKRGDSYAISMWNKKVPIGMIYTPDLAQYFADSIDLPADADQKSIDVGWSRDIPMEEVVSLCAAKLDRKIYCIGVPWALRVGVIYTIGLFMPMVREFVRMFNYFDTGSYVNDTSLQEKYFGKPPTPEDVIGRYIDGLMSEPVSGKKE